MFVDSLFHSLTCSFINIRPLAAMAGAGRAAGGVGLLAEVAPYIRALFLVKRASCMKLLLSFVKHLVTESLKSCCYLHQKVS